MSHLAQQIVDQLGKTDCSDTTTGLHFWLWDPNNDPENPYEASELPKKNCCQLLFTPSARQRRESLEIKSSEGSEKTLLALDACLFANVTGGQRCDALFIYNDDRKVIWIELKMQMTRKNPKTSTLLFRLIGMEDDNHYDGAFGQILASKQYIESLGIDTRSRINAGFVAIPELLVALAKKSQALQKYRALFKLRYKLNIEIDSILELK